jgi:hypothetical protein
MSIGDFISNAAKTVGKPVGGAIHLVGKTPVGAAVRLTESGASNAGKLAGKALRSVPVIGKPLDDVYDINLQPFKVAANILAGKNVKQSVLGGIGDDIEDAEGARGLIKVVLNIFVPGAGTAASAAIGAGYDVYKKKFLTPADINEMASAAAGAGSIGSDSFTLGQTTMSGTDPTQGANVLAKIAGVPSAAPAIAQGLKATKALSDGTTTEDSANGAMSGIEAALKGISPNTSQALMKGLTAGLTVGQAQKLQSSEKGALSSKLSLLQVLPSPLTPEESALLATIPADEKTGFTVGLNVARCVATPSQIATIRDLLPNARQQDGYDTALANHVGAVTNAPPASLSPIARAGFNVHRGIQGSDPTHASNVLSILPPPARVGVSASKREMGVEWAKVLGGVAVGAVAGFEIAGPVGALVGAVAGGFTGSKL